MMLHIEVLLLVNLSNEAPFQEVEFLQEMRNQDWHVLENGSVLYAAFPGSVADREVVAQCERDVRQAAEYSGIEHWEVVCLLKDFAETSNRFVNRQPRLANQQLRRASPVADPS